MVAAPAAHEAAPPWVIHEQSLLACPLVDPATLEEIGTLAPADFGLPLHGAIWAALTELHAGGTVPTPAAVLARIGETLGQGAEDYQEALWYVPRLVLMSPVPVGGDYFAEKVRAAALLRRCTERAERAVAMGQGGDVRALEEYRAVGQMAAGGEEGAGHTRSLAEVLVSTLNMLQERAEGKTPAAIPTALPHLDNINAWQPGDFLVLAARPGVGKSLLAVQIALHAAARGRRVLVASLEMAAEQMCLRVLAAQSGVPAEVLTTPDLLTARQWGLLNEAAARMAAWPLEFCDMKTLCLDDIMADARRLHAAGGLSLLVVDYLQLLPLGNVERTGVSYGIGQLTRKCKQMARTLAITVLALSQINREGGKRGEPELHDLAASGAIEADVDTALLMWLDEDKGLEGTVRNAATGQELKYLRLKVAKNRNGPDQQFLSLVMNKSELRVLEV